MSNITLPSFPGLAWGVQRTPIFSTITKKSVAGREYRAQNYLYPIWQFKLTYEVLRARSALSEIQQLCAFFNARGGSFDSWLYQDPDDSVATLHPFGTGNGTQTVFQLLSSFGTPGGGGFVEPVAALAAVPSIFDAGVEKFSPGDFSYDQYAGTVTFVTAPTAGHALTWTGTYYKRCRFLRDQLDFNQFMRQLWELRSMEFTTVKP